MLFVTPTHPADYGRLAVLRASMEQVGQDGTHLLVVADRDQASALRWFGGKGVEVVPHAQVLPGTSRHLQRLPAPIGSRLKVGWWLQQLAKLNLGRALGAPEWVCLDSDNFLLARLDDSDFHADDGSLHLLELVDHPVGPHVVRYNRRSAEILKLSAEAMSTQRVYTGQAVPMSALVVDEMLAWLEREYRAPWWLTMCARQGTEYALYGQFARYHHKLRSVTPVHEARSVDIYKKLDPATSVDRLVRAKRAGIKIAMVHSHLGYSQDEIERIAEQAWQA